MDSEPENHLISTSRREDPLPQEAVENLKKLMGGSWQYA